MKKVLLIVQCAWLLLVTACASSDSGPARVGEATLPKPTATSSAAAQPLPTEAPEPTWPFLPYVPEGSANQTLDVYLPASGDGPFPTILAIHGGGFQVGSKASYRQMAGHFTELGYALVSTNYRLAPRYSYPAQIEDIFCALAWVHTNQETYGFDGKRIIVMGDSAGGYLAAMLGTVDTPNAYLQNCPHTLPASEWIQAVVVYYGPFDFTSIDDFPPASVESTLQPYWGAEYSEIPPATLAEMSPMSWVDGSEPPFLLIHGTLDTTIPSSMSEEFAAALEKAGVDVELLLVEANHAFTLERLSTPANVQSLETIEAFLEARGLQ